MIMNLKSLCTFFFFFLLLRGIGGKVLVTSWDVDNCLICFSLSDTFSPLPMEPRHSKLTESSGLCADYVTSWFASVFYLGIEHLRLWLISSSVSSTPSPTVDRSWRAVFHFVFHGTSTLSRDVSLFPSPLYTYTDFSSTRVVSLLTKMIPVSLASLKGSNGQPADQVDSHNNIRSIDRGKVVYPKSDMNLTANYKYKDYEENLSWFAVTFSL